MPHHDDGGCVEWFLKVLVGEDEKDFAIWRVRKIGNKGRESRK